MEHNVFIILLFVSPLIPKKNGHLKTKTLFLIYSVQFGQGEKQNLKLCKKISNNFFLLQISDLHPPIYERPSGRAGVAMIGVSVEVSAWP